MHDIKKKVKRETGQERRGTNIVGYIVLALIAVTCALGWLNQYVCSTAIILWMQEKEIPLPGEELKKFLVYTWQKVLKII